MKSIVIPLSIGAVTLIALIPVFVLILRGLANLSVLLS